MQAIPTRPKPPDGPRRSVGTQDSPGHGQALDRSELLRRVHEPVKDGLERVKENLRGLSGTHSPFLSELLDHVLLTTGKRARPALTLLAANFHPNDGHKAEIMAAAVELLHIATLIHDDTVDNSDIRRGKATVSSLWGRNAAVLLGDYVFATSATYVCDTGNIRVIRRFSETIMELSSGELHEMAAAYDWKQSRQQYMQRIYNKTASLFTTAGEAGALLSGASEPTIQALKGYAYNVGMAFQIVDDILDLDATSQEVGKPVGNDLAQGIMTLPAIIAMERRPDDNPIPYLFRSPGDEKRLSQALEFIQDPSIIEAAYGVAQEFSHKALECLSALERNPSRASLELLVSYVLKRRS